MESFVRYDTADLQSGSAVVKGLAGACAGQICLLLEDVVRTGIAANRSNFAASAVATDTTSSSSSSSSRQQLPAALQASSMAWPTSVVWHIHYRCVSVLLAPACHRV
jgi:hypothetical protein